MAVGVFDRYWDYGNDEYALATSTINLSDLDHRIIVSGAVTGGGTGYAIVDELYPNQGIATDVCGTCKGWYFHLLENRERCLGDLLINREMVYFLSYQPARDPNDPCIGGGTSNLYGVYYTSGTSVVTPVFDITGDGSLDEQDTVIIGESAVSAGIKQLKKGFAGGGLKAKGAALYLPMGLKEEIPPAGSPFQTGVTSWRELSW